MKLRLGLFVLLSMIAFSLLGQSVINIDLTKAKLVVIQS